MNLALSTACVAHYDKDPGNNERLNAMKSASITQKGQSPWVIMPASPGKPGQSFAVDELQKYLKQITGCKLPIAEYAAKGNALVVGLRDDLTEADRRALPPAAQGHDGYALVVTPRRIILAGENGRATIYAVYELLEQIGCRWFYPTHDPKDPEVVPRIANLKIPVGARAIASPIPYRIYNGSAWFFDLDPAMANAQTDHALKCRYNMMGWQCSQKPSPLEQSC